MIFLSVDEIIHLHDTLIARTGGLAGLRDKGLLESAVYSAFASFEETEQYPALVEKAARLAYAITNNHAFTDGNKRIGIYVMLVTLKVNDVDLSYTQNELIKLGLGIADGSLSYENVLKWLNAHI